LIKSKDYPKLFSIVFGEGMVNDAVAIILFKVVGTINLIQGTIF
jgi:sodium/hydrogen exchanger-like protein 6/7/sodium/hydrogen exchanger 8